VQVGKFLGFMLTNRGIEVNLDKCQAVIDVRSPSSLKEVQQLIGRLAAVSRVLSCGGDKAFAFFSSIKKKEKFEWTPKCEAVFRQIKTFLCTPLVLIHPSKGYTLFLYLSISNNAMSSVLVQDSPEGEKQVYFVSKVFNGAELRYQKKKKACPGSSNNGKKTQPIFQCPRIIVKSNFPIKQVL
jgi:hypothetical protein